MYYKGTIRQIRKRIQQELPGTRPEEFELATPGCHIPLSHLLWMCDQIEKMDTESIDDAVKAGRWIGWILAHIEDRCLWSNKDSRRFVRNDKKKGFDKPHQK